MSAPAFPAPSAAVVAFRDNYATARRRALRNQFLFVTVFLICFLASAGIGEFYPDRILRGIPRLGEFIAKIIPDLGWATLGADIAEWFKPWKIWLGLLLETILIAYLATLIGIAAGFALSFSASRNLSPNRWALWISRRALEIARTVPDLVWALIFVFCFGIGPMAGVLAIGLHATGALGKLYSEANENISMRAVEGVRAAGGSWWQTIRYAVVPQVLPNILSYSLLRFEINVRSSTIIGFVGAGGLGQELRTAISFQYYTDISALFLIILLTVVVIDFSCEKVRHRFIGITERAL